MRFLFYALVAMQLSTASLPAQPPGNSLIDRDRVQIDIERDYGCKSIEEAPGFDNSRLLNQCFQDASRREFSYIHVPGKAYRIDDTVRIPPGTSVAIVGTGATLFQAQMQYRPRPDGRGPAPFGGPASRLVWFGPEDRPMVVHAGDRLQWQGVSLFGRFAKRDWRAPEGTKAAIGLLVMNSQHGSLAGTFEAPLLSVAECGTGVELAHQDSHETTAAVTFGFLLTHNCDVGMRVSGQSRREIVVQFYWPFFTGIAFRFENGGRLNCQSLGLMAPGTILSLGKTNVAGSTFQIDGLIVDNHATDGVQFSLVHMDHPAAATITMSGHLPHSNYEHPIAWLSGPASLTLRDVYGLREGAVVCDSAQARTTDDFDVVGPRVWLDACRMNGNADPSRTVQRTMSEGTWSLRWTGCLNHWAEPFNDGTATGETLSAE